MAVYLGDIIKQDNLDFYILHYHDLLVDVNLLLWNKCKNHFARVHSDSFDAYKTVYQDELFDKVNYLFYSSHRLKAVRADYLL